MSLKKLASLGMMIAVFAFAACSDDSGTTPKKDTGVKADLAKTDMPAATEMGPGDTGPGSDAPAGACINATDPAALAKTYDGKTITEVVSAQSACLTDSDPKACLIAAVKTATNNEITDGCVTCFAESALCSVSNCDICITAPTGAECGTCRCGGGANKTKTNCVAAFETCSGIKSTTTCP